MKSVAATALAAATLASAGPLSLAPRSDLDTANDWAGILNGEEGASCADLAVIFARGTFDPGNIGPWVGGPFREALGELHDNMAFQGVDPEAYKADLAGYIEDGGSNECAESMGEAVKSYAEKCPDAKIVVSGWSQGALCARKSFEYIGDTSSQVSHFVTFGDPFELFLNDMEFPVIPEGVESIVWCKSTTIDPLCSEPLDEIDGSPEEFISQLKAMWEELDDTELNDEQKDAVVELIKELPKQATKQIDTLAKDIFKNNIRRWMLTPAHFLYAEDGSTNYIAEQLVGSL